MQTAVSVVDDCESAPQASRPLKIALLGYRCNPFSGGQGVYIRNVSAGLAARGHQVDVISGQPYPDLVDHPNIRLIKLPGLNLYGGPGEVAPIGWRNLLSFTDQFEWWSYQSGGFPEPYTYGRRVHRYLREHHGEYDLIHDNQTLSWGVLQLADLPLPLITTIHHPIAFDLQIALSHAPTIGLRLLIRRWHHFLSMQTKVARRLPHIVTVSENSRRDIQSAFDLPSSRIDVVPNGIDMDVYRPLPHITRQPGCIITTASADQPLKGTQHLVPAIAQVRKQVPHLKLIFVGKPKPEGTTAKLIEQHQLSDCIEFVHGISNEELVELYAKASIAVVPSEYEGFGLPAAEAMACGVPVVSTDGGALAEVVSGVGVVVPKADPAALAEALASLLNDEARQHTMAQAGREHVMQHFSAQQAALEMEQYYNRVLAL